MGTAHTDIVRSTLAAIGVLTLALPTSAQSIAADRHPVVVLERALETLAEREALREQGDRDRERQDRDREARDRQREAQDRERERQDREREQLERLYEQATADLDAARWEAAISKLTRIAQAGGEKADGAIYWKAYADVKRGQFEEALAGVEALKAKKSRWIKEAEALQLQIKQAAGQKVDPETQADDDLKLMAINSLLHSDQERAIPLLEQVLKGSGSPKLKERALFVLTQTNSSQARAIVGNLARGDANPDLQMRAIRNLGFFGGQQSRQILYEIYSSASGTDVKRAILQSFRLSGDREHVAQAARGESDPQLRAEAINQLGLMKANAELAQLYEKETTAAVKKQIVRSLFLTGQPEFIVQIARADGDPDVRLDAIRRLGLMGREKTGAALVEMYGKEKETSLKAQVIQSLFLQQNATALIQIARAEQDPTLKREAVKRLSNMKATPEITEFMMELLKK
ncbi:MAG: HEAT repeat domain-containing protein [Acidobacteria bacterium]|nr:HEAT repeat domain-containing protein [Acidobacteriota bacterium]